MRLILLILLSSFFLASCSEKKLPPLPGKRMNVLHYDLMRDANAQKVKVEIPLQNNVDSWKASDVDQFVGLPFNFSLSEELKLSNTISIPSKDPAVIIVGDVLYSYSKATLNAYDTANNKKLWSIPIIKGAEKNDILGGGMIYDAGVIYLSSGARDLVALDAKTGNELWRYKAHNVLRSIATVQGNSIYIVSIDNIILCISKEGKLVWRYDAPIYTLLNNHIYLSNLIYQDKMITVTTAGDLIALSKIDGEELTQVNLATASIIGDGSLTKGPISSPFLDRQFLYVATGEEDLIKIDLDTPQISWRQNFPGINSLWISDKFAFLIISNNQLVAIDTESGALVWSVDLPKEEKKKKNKYFYGPIMAGNQLIVASNNGEFFTFSPYDGKLKASYKNKFALNRMPIIANSKLYFIGTNGEVAIWQ